MRRLTADNFRIEGGERVTAIHSDGRSIGRQSRQCLNVMSISTATFRSTHCVWCKAPKPRNRPTASIRCLPPWISRSRSIARQISIADRTAIARSEDLPEPEIDYLAKDYASFRRLMLDRMAVLMPQWQERNPADLGDDVSRTLAYVGDY